MPNYKLIQELIDKDKSTISFLYSKKDKFGAFFSELFLYSKVHNLDEKEIQLKLKCAYKSYCYIYVTHNSMRLSFKKNYLGRFKLINNDDILFFKANLGRKILDVNLNTDKFSKSFKDEIVNQPDLYNQLHEEKLNFLSDSRVVSHFETVKQRKLV